MTLRPRIADPTHGIPTGQTGLWLERALRGEEGVWDRILARFMPRLLAYADSRIGRTLRGRTTAADIVQGAWRRVLVGFKSEFRPNGSGSFYSWLCLQCLREVRELGRRRVLDTTPLGQDTAEDSKTPDFGLSAQTTLDPLRAAILREQTSMLVRGLGLLPLDERRLLEDVYISHRPLEDVARRRSIAIPTLHKQLSRARARLRGFVGRDVFGPEDPRPPKGSPPDPP